MSLLLFALFFVWSFSNMPNHKLFGFWSNVSSSTLHNFRSKPWVANNHILTDMLLTLWCKNKTWSWCRFHRMLICRFPQICRVCTAPFVHFLNNQGTCLELTKLEGHLVLSFSPGCSFRSNTCFPIVDYTTYTQDPLDQTPVFHLNLNGTHQHLWLC
jgi:hypothetical protein